MWWLPPSKMSCRWRDSHRRHSGHKRAILTSGIHPTYHDTEGKGVITQTGSPRVWPVGLHQSLIMFVRASLSESTSQKSHVIQIHVLLTSNHVVSFCVRSLELICTYAAFDTSSMCCCCNVFVQQPAKRNPFAWGGGGGVCMCASLFLKFMTILAAFVWQLRLTTTATFYEKPEMFSEVTFYHIYHNISQQTNVFHR